MVIDTVLTVDEPAEDVFVVSMPVLDVLTCVGFCYSFPGSFF